MNDSLYKAIDALESAKKDPKSISQDNKEDNNEYDPQITLPRQLSYTQLQQEYLSPEVNKIDQTVENKINMLKTG